MSVSREEPNPESVGDGSTPAKGIAVKDRGCPYCSEVFTSSSLGRHLDQFIKDDKPKPPDGKHNVEEIQKMRGNVTRRQARTSSVKRASSAMALHDMTPNKESSPPAKRVRTNGTSGTPLISWNRPNWLSTGVIPDLSPSAGPQFPSSTGVTRAGIEAKEKLAIAERDEGRAAKLALTELLDNIKASLVHFGTSKPYPFEFLVQNFPSLVLLILPSQPTIQSAQVIPNSQSWPINPPSKEHLLLLRQKLSARLEEFQRDQRNNRERDHSEDSSRSAISAESGPKNDFRSYHEHLEAAYGSWVIQSEPEKLRQWHLASLRAYALEQETHTETQEKLVKAEQQLAHQAAQIKRLNTLQQPQEFLVTVPMASPLPREAAQAVKSFLAPDGMSAEALIEKWKPSVKNNRGFQRGFFSGIYESAAAAADGNIGREENPNQTDVDGDHDMANTESSTNGAVDADIQAQLRNIPPVNGSHNPSPTQAVHAGPVSAAVPSSGNLNKSNNGHITSSRPALTSINNHDLPDADGDSVDASGEDDDDLIAAPITQKPAARNTVLAKSSPAVPSPITSQRVSLKALDRAVLDPSLRNDHEPGNSVAGSLMPPGQGAGVKSGRGAASSTAPVPVMALSNAPNARKRGKR